MATLIKLVTNKTGSGRTYATKENAIKAVEKKFPGDECSHLRYIIMEDVDGRFFPVFIGAQALQDGVHFHFHVLG